MKKKKATQTNQKLHLESWADLYYVTSSVLLKFSTLRWKVAGMPCRVWAQNSGSRSQE